MSYAAKFASITYLMNPKRYVLFLCVLTAGLICFSVDAYGQQVKKVTLKGQVVCSVCWFEATDRKKTPYGNAADIKCAKDCSEEGLPQALAVEDEKGFTLYTLEVGAFKPNGKDFLDLVPNSVEVEGDLRTEKDKNFLKVNSLKVLSAPLPKPTPVSDDAVLALKDLCPPRIRGTYNLSPLKPFRFCSAVNGP